MHVLMLGWEFPPFITGGLGTACYGLTRALDQHQVEVTFVLPKAANGEHAAHVRLVSPSSASPVGVDLIDAGPTPAIAPTVGSTGAAPAAPRGAEGSTPAPRGAGFAHVRLIAVPGPYFHPYPGGATGPVGAPMVTRARSVNRPARPGGPAQGAAAGTDDGDDAATDEAHGAPAAGAEASPPPLPHEYGMDLVSRVDQYARFCFAATRGLRFDVIHAHDWMTYPAGLRIAQVTGRPLVVHVHSTEFDRSGEHINQRIYDIERRGMHGAMRVIAVSQLTKNVIVNRYGIHDGHVEVVYNGVELDEQLVSLTGGIRSKDKIVLYFGRITYQKGPEYFVRAAKRVLEVMDNVKFVVAGSGDQAERMIRMAADLGIGNRVLFTGFLRGADIKRVFALADLYVMPSVSEPFGIAPLEAMGHQVPVLISKSSGVSEVLSHALKVDFWDVDDMANKIIAVLRYPPLGQTLLEHGSMEVRRLTWDGAATKCEQVYRAVIAEMRQR